MGRYMYVLLATMKRWSVMADLAKKCGSLVNEWHISGSFGGGGLLNCLKVVFFIVCNELGKSLYLQKLKNRGSLVAC